MKFLIALAFLLPLSALADSDASDRNYLRIGTEHVVFHDDNPGFIGPGIPPGFGLQTQTQNLTTIYAAYARALTSHLEVELVLGQPAIFHVQGRGPALLPPGVPYGGQVLVNGRQVAPAIEFHYVFNEQGAFYRPFIGAGLVYSRFNDIKVTSLGSLINGGPTTANFSDSLGAIVMAGVNLKLLDHWQAQLRVSKADVRPDVTTTTLGIQRVNHYDLGPVVYIAALSYGF